MFLHGTYAARTASYVLRRQNARQRSRTSSDSSGNSYGCTFKPFGSAEGLPSRQLSARRPLEFVEYDVSYLTMVSGSWRFLRRFHPSPDAIPMAALCRRRSGELCRRRSGEIASRRLQETHRAALTSYRSPQKVSVWPLSPGVSEALTEPLREERWRLDRLLATNDRPAVGHAPSRQISPLQREGLEQRTLGATLALKDRLRVQSSL
jgi:hypothetical protein